MITAYTKTHFVLIIIFSFFLGNLPGQTQFALNAVIEGFPDSTRVIIDRIGTDLRVQETQVTLFLIDGKFSYAEELTRPTFYSIRIQPQHLNNSNFTESESLGFWAENTNMSVVGKKGEIDFSDFSINMRSL